MDHADREKAAASHQQHAIEPQPIHLTWRSWLVVLTSCFAIMSQVFVVTAAGSVIAFSALPSPIETPNATYVRATAANARLPVIQDLGAPALSGWIIQGPLLMQSVLSPSVGRLSDVLDRKYLASIPPLVAFVGAVVSAKAESMAVLIGGGILIGTTLATIAIVQAIPAEVLPLKYRAIANGMAFIGGAVGGLVGSLGAGGLTNQSPSGWVRSSSNIYSDEAEF